MTQRRKFDLEKIANLFGEEIADAAVNGKEAFAVVDEMDPDHIIYGPIYDGELVTLEMIAERAKETLDEMDPEDIVKLSFSTVLVGDDSDPEGWFCISRLLEIIELAENVNFEGGAGDDIIMTAQQTIKDELLAILDEVLWHGGDLQEMKK